MWRQQEQPLHARPTLLAVLEQIAHQRNLGQTGHCVQIGFVRIVGIAGNEQALPFIDEGLGGDLAGGDDRDAVHGIGSQLSVFDAHIQTHLAVR